MPLDLFSTTPVSALQQEWRLPVPVEGVPEVRLRDGSVVPPQVCEVLHRRGITNMSEWLQPTLKAFMPDPYVLPSVEAAARRMCQAVRDGEQVALYGDYDVDGATSVGQTYRWFAPLSVPGRLPFRYIPDRLKEGYGPNSKAMETLAGQGVTLLVVQDSGTSALEPLAHAVSLGMDVVVLDHHEPREDGVMPPAIVVNPKLLASLPVGLDYLCTAGLTFLVLVACNRLLRDEGWFAETGKVEPDLRELVMMAALGSVCDVVPLVGLNRALVSAGLGVMDRNPGVFALMNATQNHKHTAHSCGYIWGPCINAGGRLGDTSQGATLLSSDDPEKCAVMAEALLALNKERRGVQDAIMDKAYLMIDEAGGVGDPSRVLVLYNPEWHPGVIGVAAGKLKEELRRSMVFIGAGGKGSARAVKGFNIGRAFLEAVENGMLIKGGGHAAAAGLTVDPARIPELLAFLQSRSVGIVLSPVKLELVLEADAVPMSLMRTLMLMEPTGVANRPPKVMLTGGKLCDIQVRKGRHIKATLRKGRGGTDIMVWNCMDTVMGRMLLSHEGALLDAVGRLSINEFRGRNTVEMIVEDVRPG